MIKLIVGIYFITLLPAIMAKIKELDEQEVKANRAQRNPKYRGQ